MMRLNPIFVSRQSQYFITNCIRFTGTRGAPPEKLTIKAADEKIENILAEYSPSGVWRKQATDSYQHEGVQGDVDYQLPNPLAVPKSNHGLSQLTEGFQAEEYDAYGRMPKPNKIIHSKMPYSNLTLGQLLSINNSGHGLWGSNSVRLYSTEPKKEAEAASEEPVDESKLSQGQKLKRAVAQYGSTVMVFHITISLMSLGSFYLLVSSGVDLIAIMAKLGVGQSILESKAVAGAGTFVVAYAVHKVFAPVRIGITLTSTPFIVRYLRGIGFLKTPKPKP